jgi:hypothetical protein
MTVGTAGRRRRKHRHDVGQVAGEGVEG